MSKGIAMLCACLLSVSLLPLLSEAKGRGFSECGSETGAHVEADVELLFPVYQPRGRMKEDYGFLAQGTVVELLSADRDSYRVAVNGTSIEIPRTAILPMPQELVPLPNVGEREICAAAAALGLSSETPYLLWVDLSRLETYLLIKSEDGWRLLRRIPCSAGDLTHPTPRGSFTVNAHRLALGKADRYTAVYALHLADDYFLHSVLLAPEGNEISDGRLGARISHGCIRHSVEDSRYLYRTVPDGTAVMIR